MESHFSLCLTSYLSNLSKCLSTLKCLNIRMFAEQSYVTPMVPSSIDCLRCTIIICRKLLYNIFLFSFLGH